MNRISLQWGLIIGGASLLWLYLAYWTGLHTSGMVLFNFFMFGWLLINALGYWRGLGAVRIEGSKSGSWGYVEGLKCAALMALISAVIAVIAQVGYWTLVHPEWPDYMMEQTRIHHESRGITGAELEGAVSKAEKSFTLPVYAVQSAGSHFFVGMIFSGLLLVFLRKPVREARGEIS